MSTPKISVIIPVYNVGPYLRECLDSVVNQTLRDIEIICVNDGSTDNSGAILVEYAARDERIIVITQKNRGLSAARNVGIDAAKGKYIYFIDSDDYIDLDALEVLYNRAEELKLDMLFFDFVYFYDGVEPEPWSFQREEYNGTYLGIELLKKFRDEGTYWVTVWAYLIRREFLQNSGVRYVDGMLHEDMIFTPLLMMKAHQVSHFGCAFYHRRVRPNSITTVHTAKNVAGLVTGIQEMLLYGLSDDRNESEALETWRMANGSGVPRTSKGLFSQVAGRRATVGCIQKAIYKMDSSALRIRLHHDRGCAEFIASRTCSTSGRARSAAQRGYQFRR